MKELWPGRKVKLRTSKEFSAYRLFLMRSTHRIFIETKLGLNCHQFKHFVWEAVAVIISGKKCLNQILAELKK